MLDLKKTFEVTPDSAHHVLFCLLGLNGPSLEFRLMLANIKV